MKEHNWKLGDPCFIVGMAGLRIQIMPASVIRISGLPNPRAAAMALNENRDDYIGAGARSCEGTPFASAWEARIEAYRRLALRTSWLAALLTRIRFAGTRPHWEIPKDFPAHGQVVYILDEETREICEVIVGFLGLYLGRFSIGYDSSPGNPEANMVRINSWWPTRETAEIHARQKYGGGWTLVSKEKGAVRIDQEIQKLWDGAAARLRDPEWNRRHNEAMRKVFR